MSRPWMEFMDDLEVVACVDLVGGEYAIFAIDFEDGDRDHQVAGKLESVRLCEREVVRHLRGSIRERANSRSMAPKKARGRARSPRWRSLSGPSLRTDPLRVDRGRSGLGPGRHHKRAGLVCFRPGELAEGATYWVAAVPIQHDRGHRHWMPNDGLGERILHR